MQRVHLPCEARGGIHAPDNQVPINTARAHLRHIPRFTFIRAHRRDRILVHGEQLRFARARNRAGHAEARLPARVCVAKRVERRAVQTPDGRAAVARAPRGSTGGLRCRRRVVEGANGAPASLCALEKNRLAVVPCGDELVFFSPRQGDVWQRAALDREDSRAARIDDADRGVMACT